MVKPSFAIKLTELVIAIACLVLQQYSYDLTDLPTLVLCSGTYVGFIIVLSGEIIGELISEPQDAFIEAWWSAISAMLFGACAARTLLNWRNVPDSPRKDTARACAMCAIAITSVLIVDTIRILCSEEGTLTVYSSRPKVKKTRAPKSEVNKPMTNYSPIRLVPAKVTLQDISAAGASDFMEKPVKPSMASPKISPPKLTLAKFPNICKPLRMAPKVQRNFW